MTEPRFAEVDGKKKVIVDGEQYDVDEMNRSVRNEKRLDSMRKIADKLMYLVCILFGVITFLWIQPKHKSFIVAGYAGISVVLVLLTLYTYSLRRKLIFHNAEQATVHAITYIALWGLLVLVLGPVFVYAFFQ